MWRRWFSRWRATSAVEPMTGPASALKNDAGLSPSVRESEAQRGAETDPDPLAASFDPDQPVAFPIEDAIDLHTFSPKETASAVEEYLWEAQARGFREVRIIHGKGKGVQRRIIQAVVAKHPAVESFADAPPDRGGWGATLAWLRPANPG